MDKYWENVTEGLDEVAKDGATVEDVMRILKARFGSSSTEAFCEGSGGDRGLVDVLLDERDDWTTVWMDADYYWCAQDSHGDRLSYIEGDVARGNCKSRV